MQPLVALDEEFVGPPFLGDALFGVLAEIFLGLDVAEQGLCPQHGDGGHQHDESDEEKNLHGDGWK